MHPLTAYTVKYDGVMRSLGGRSLSAVAERLLQLLPPLWDLSYKSMTPGPAEILEVRLDTIRYHFDHAASVGGSGDDRVVVVYGFSKPTGEKRDSSRMRGFLGGGLSDPEGGKLDKGHFASHAQGGPMDMNLFPQRPDVNRGCTDGWSTRGVSFREMERWCVANPGAFFFARPIYLDDTWTPHALEYGVLRSATDLWVERFPN